MVRVVCYPSTIGQRFIHGTSSTDFAAAGLCVRKTRSEPATYAGRPMPAKPIVVKRSVLVRGRNTNITLEDEFWEGFKLIADLRRLTITELIGNRRGGEAATLTRQCMLDPGRTLSRKGEGGPVCEEQFRSRYRKSDCFFTYFFHPCCQAGGVLASIRMKAMRHGLVPLLTQAWLVPCWTKTSPAFTCTSVSSSSMSISPSSTMA